MHTGGEGKEISDICVYIYVCLSECVHVYKCKCKCQGVGGGLTFHVLGQSACVRELECIGSQGRVHIWGLRVLQCVMSCHVVLSYGMLCYVI